MEIGLFRGLVTALLLLLFIGLWLWTWSRKRSTEYEAASQLPLEGGDYPPGHNDGEQDPREQEQ